MFLPLIDIIAASIDMARMDMGVVGRVDSVKIETTSRQVRRTVITYSFSDGNQHYQSDRYFPGFLAGKWAGGAEVTKEYAVGQPITVHFNSWQPSCCAIQFGWSKGTIGWAAIGWGIVLQIVPRKRTGIAFTNWASAGLALAFYGFALLSLGPWVVRIRSLHWHALAWCIAFAIVLAYRAIQGWIAQQSHALEPAIGPVSNSE
jgi:hypothetical protein